jgi:hypothetical protein
LERPRAERTAALRATTKVRDAPKGEFLDFIFRISIRAQ